MIMKKNDIATIAAVLAAAGQVQDEAALAIRDGILWLRIRGNLDNGRTALKALNEAGVNQVIDNNFATDENSVIYAAGADYCVVWVDFVDHEPLFRNLA